jgi:protein-disulfide isomerase
MSKNKSMGKRQQIKQRREQRQRRQRLTMIIGVSAVALLLVAVLVIPQIQRANAPVGEIVQITPRPHPQADGRTMGDPNAPVTVEVFEDFQCPVCRKFSADTEPLIVNNYVETGQVHYIFRQFPFIDDRVPTNESDQAANASMCAAAQNRFWDYHDMLFANWNGENQGTFNNNRLVAFAEALNLDMSEFNTCFQSNQYSGEIQQDQARAAQFNVTGTPTVVVNGQVVGDPGYVPTYDQISQAIEAALSS